MPSQIQDQFARVPISRRANAKNLLNAPSSPPFRWTHHPERFHICGEHGELLPQLGKMVLEPGVNGVHANGSDHLARVGAAKNGWQVLELQSFPELGDDGYLTAVEGREGLVHFSVFETPTQQGNVVRWSKQAEGQARYMEFLRDLLRRRIIAEPTVELIEFMIGMKESELNRRGAKDLTKIANRRAYDLVAKQIERLRVAFERSQRGVSVLEPQTDLAVPHG